MLRVSEQLQGLERQLAATAGKVDALASGLAACRAASKLSRRGRASCG